MTTLTEARRNTRIWAWKPQWYWHGWSTLSPIGFGHDEYARRTIVIGWTITGRVIIPIGDCGDPDCVAEANQFLAAGGYDALEDES